MYAVPAERVRCEAAARISTMGIMQIFHSSVWRTGFLFGIFLSDGCFCRVLVKRVILQIKGEDYGLK